RGSIGGGRWFTRRIGDLTSTARSPVLRKWFACLASATTIGLAGTGTQSTLAARNLPLRPIPGRRQRTCSRKYLPLLPGDPSNPGGGRVRERCASDAYG